MKRRVAVLIGGAHVPRFGLMAIDAIDDCDEITVFSCTNTVGSRNVRLHGAYYALNLLTIRNPLTAPAEIAETRKRIVDSVVFESVYEGNWQRLPDAVIDRLAEFDVVVKLGMGLLRVPDGDRLATPILSYHHGDPDHYRGRPAGFWEIVHGAQAMGQIVQVISNRLDAGKIVAFGETKVLPHSYRATLINSFSHSPLLINQAIRNALTRTFLDKPCSGKNYRLPSNVVVIRFILLMAWRALRRLLYGVTIAKHWQVSTAKLRVPIEKLLVGDSFPAPQEWATTRSSRQYAFFADPFFSTAPQGVLVEAMSRRTGLGEIVLLDGERQLTVSSAPGHLSYPFTLEAGGRQLVIPEAASWSEPRTYVIEAGEMKGVGVLRIEGDCRLLDPTLVEHGERLYLFGNDHRVGPNALFVWSAASIDDEFVLHPASPVLVSPKGARMGGSFLHVDGRLVRLGQSFLDGYGDGLFAFEVEKLSPTDYRERQIGVLKFDTVKGPHTLNVRGSEIVFDWYTDRPSLLAAPLRLRARRRERELARVRAAEAGQ